VDLPKSEPEKEREDIMPEEIISSLNEPIEEVQPLESEIQPGVSQVVPASGQPPVNASTQEIFDWMKDERKVRMWKGNDKVDAYINANPDAKKFLENFYKSYRNIEKVHDPIKKKAEALEGQISTLSEFMKQYGIEPDIEKLKPVLDEYKTFKDPQNPEMQALAELKYWVQNEATGQQVLKFFDQLRQEEMHRKYPGWNAEQIQKQIEIERKIKNLEEKEQQANVKAEYDTSLKTINEQCDRAKKYAESKGFVFSEDIRSTLLDDCMKNKIEPAYVFAHFVNKYDEQVSKSFEEKIKQDQLKGLNKNRDKVVIPAGTTKPASGSGSLKDKFTQIVEKMGIT